MQAALAAVLGLGLTFAHAQPGGMGMGGGPQFSGALARLFGNTAFSSSLEMQVKLAMGAQEMNISMPGKISFDGTNARLEIDLSEAKGMPGSPEQLKAMGMDKMVIISRLDKKLLYMVYPGKKFYGELPLRDEEAKPESAFKTEKTELGKETIEGHSCVKNKVVVTDDKDKKREFTVWSATDLKDFPVKIEFTDVSGVNTLTFRDVKMAKPAADSFEPPAGFEKLDLMKMMGGMGGPGAGGPPPNK